MEHIVLSLKARGALKIPEDTDDFLRLHDQEIDAMIHKPVTSKNVATDKIEMFAQMLVTRTSMGRMEEVIVPEKDAPEKEYEIKERLPGKILFKRPLKEFTKMSRNSDSKHNTIRVCSSAPTKFPARYLSTYLRVVSSDLWTKNETKSAGKDCRPSRAEAGFLRLTASQRENRANGCWRSPGHPGTQSYGELTGIGAGFGVSFRQPFHHFRA